MSLALDLPQPDSLLTRTVGVAVALLMLVATPSTAHALDGDLDGDSNIGPADEALFAGLYGSEAGDALYDPIADLNDDGTIDVGDLALFAAAYGSHQGIGDISPPWLIPSLNDIPDAMNDLLVAPPDGFQITFEFKSLGASLLDTSSFEVTSALDLGPHPAGTDLASLFQVTPTRAIWEVPLGFDLARTTHSLTARIRDLAGNEAEKTYAFAVRDFPFGQPFGNTQIFFLDFDTDRGNGTFSEDLRDFGLCAASEPEIEAIVRENIISEILRRVRNAYGLEADGSPGEDPVNIVFTSSEPAGPHNRVCVGGVSPQVSAMLGLATIDVNNLDEFTDECEGGTQFGVFPQAMETLWGGEQAFIDAFDGVDPDLGGTPVGEHPQDATMLDPGFNPDNANLAQISRLIPVLNATRAFSQIVAVGLAHEIGHMLGLTAPGDAPAGLFGGTTGGRNDHNVTVSGATPGQNFLMNAGGSFEFEEITGTGGESVPSFRSLNWAYLHDRVALSEQVTGLYPPPVLSSVTPNPASFPQGQTTDLTFHGDDFVDPPLVDLLPVAGGPPLTVFNVTLVDAQTLTGTINRFLVLPGFYDVQVINGDGQEIVLPNGLEVQ